MVSRISNPSVADGENNGVESDYMQALNSVMYSSNVVVDRSNQNLGSSDNNDGSSGSRPTRIKSQQTNSLLCNLTQQEDTAIQEQLIKIRDKIRRGELLSCQIASSEQR